MMFSSLSSLAQLPPSTKIYCGHEYAEANVRFARSLEPSNPALTAVARRVAIQRNAFTPSVPSTLASELETNPFLRVRSEELRENAKVRSTDDDVSVFATVRRLKDQFAE